MTEEQMKARIAELEDCILELAPFAMCHEVIAQTTIAGRSDAECLLKAYDFKRDTLYLNKFAYRRAAKLVAHRLKENGIRYIL